MAIAARERAHRQRSEQGVREATAEVDRLAEELRALLSGVAERTSNLPTRIDRDTSGTWFVRIDGFTTTFAWQPRYRNTLEGAVLYVHDWNYPKSASGRHEMDSRSDKVVKNEYEVGLDETNTWVWKGPGGPCDEHTDLTTTELGGQIVNRLLDRTFGVERPGAPRILFL